MASSLSAEGIVLRKYYLRETSLILIVFTREFGKIRGVLKGVRSPYPQFAGNFEILTRCRLQFYKRKKSMDLITGCETLDFFPVVRKDIERLTYANYFIELVDLTMHDYDVNAELYDVLVASLGMLCTEGSAKRIARIFELRFLKGVGLNPNLANCTICNNKILGIKPAFSVKSGGIVCTNCANDQRGQVLNISLGTVNFMRRIQSSDLGKISQIKVASEVGREIETLLGRFLEYNFAREMKSMNFLHELEKKGAL